MLWCVCEWCISKMGAKCGKVLSLKEKTGGCNRKKNGAVKLLGELKKIAVYMCV